jgi:hypothetical protein
MEHYHQMDPYLFFKNFTCIIRSSSSSSSQSPPLDITPVVIATVFQKTPPEFPMTATGSQSTPSAS